MYGLLTADADIAREGIGDVTYYLADRVSGQSRDPVDDVVNSVACWGDTATVREDPDRAAVTADSSRAAPDVEGHHWGTVCPTDPGYRETMLDRIAEYGRDGDVRLTTLGFPGEEFCRCDRCDEQFQASEHEDRTAGRCEVITGFTAAASERVDGDVVATLYPDPYPGSLQARAGLDPAALDEHVDGFLVPLCGASYETTYWVETLARGFDRLLNGLDASLTIQLSASGVDSDRLVGLARQVDPHADAIVFGAHRGEEDAVRETIDRLGAVESPVSV